MVIFRSLIAAAGLALAVAPIAVQAQSVSPKSLRTTWRPFDQPHVLFPVAPPVGYNNASGRYKPITRYWHAKPVPPRHGGPIRSHGAR